MKAREIVLPTSWGVHAVYRLLESDGASVLAVEYPGANFSTEKPLFHYIRKQALRLGIDVLSVEYGYQAARVKTEFSEEVLRNIAQDILEAFNLVTLNKYKRVVFISKSMGTRIAGMTAEALKVPIAHVFLTPIRATLAYMREGCLVVTGTEDPLFAEADRALIPSDTEVLVVPGADHGLETQDGFESLEMLRVITERVQAFLQETKGGRID